MKNSVAYILLFFLLGSCVSNKNVPSPTEVVFSEEDVSYMDSTYFFDDWDFDDMSEFDYLHTLPSYQPSRTIFVDIIHTKIECAFNWNQSQMNGKATLTMKPHFFATDSVVLDAKGMEIKKIEMNGNALSYEYKDSLKLHVYLGKMYKKGEAFTFIVEYISKPEDRITSGSSAITSDKGLYFINPKGEANGKMPQIWTQGETEANSVWFPTIDAPNSKSTQETIITVDNKYVTLSNGKLVSSKKNSDGTRTDHWKQDTPHAPYLFMMAVGEFKIVKDSYTKADGKQIEVNYYVEPEFENSARAIFGKTPKMISFFSKKLGVEYPWDKYSQIVVRDFVSGAMENTGAVVFSDFVYKTNRTLIDGNDESTIAHELFHHWFGDLVTCESWSNLPLNESFANYSQYLWDEFEYGQDEADYQAKIEADDYYSSATYSGYHELIEFEYFDKENMFDAHSYNKGGRILHMLRNYLGDEAFFMGLNKYLTTNSYKSAEVHDLRKAFEDVSGEDLNWFFNQWFLGAGHPIIFSEQTLDVEKSTVTILLKQAQDISQFPEFRLPLKVAVWDDLGKHIHSIILDSLNKSFTFPFTGTLLNVHMDDDQMLLAKVYEEKPIEQFVHQYYNASRFTSKTTALKHINKSNIDKKEQIFRDALQSGFWGMRLEALNILGAQKNKTSEEQLNVIKDMVLKDEKSTIRKTAIDFMELLEKTEASELIKKTIGSDSSFMVINTALTKLMALDSVSALVLAREFKNSTQASLRISSAEILASLGDTTDYNFIEKMILAENPRGQNQMRLMMAYTDFIVRAPLDYQDRSLKVFSFLKENTNEYSNWYLEMGINSLLESLYATVEELQIKINDEELLGQFQKANELRNEQQKASDLITNLSPLVTTP